MTTPAPIKPFQVHHFPQVPCKAFIVDCDTVHEAIKVSETLAQYDLFQYAQNIKSDYSNATAILAWSFDEEEWSELDEFEIAEIAASIEEGVL